MTFKKIFYLDQNLFSLIRKKVLNKLFFNKSYLRVISYDNELTNIVDNYSFFETSFQFSHKIEKKKKFLMQNIKNLPSVGNSINSNTFLYKHKLDSLYRFEYSVYSFLPKFLMNQYLSCLYRCSKLKKIKTYLFFLSPKKGGFNCYYRGFRGFMPKSHGKKNLKKICKNLLKLHQFKKFPGKFKTAFISYCIFLKNLKKHLFFRFSFLNMKMQLRKRGRSKRIYVYKKLKYIKKFKKKKVRMRSNIIFLSFKNEKLEGLTLQQNENLKI